MPRTRAVVAALAISVASFTPAVSAAPSPASLCPIVDDQAGDARYQYLASFGPAPALDIVGVDMVSTASEVAMRLRLVTTTVEGSDQFAQRAAMVWMAAFTVGGVRYAFWRERASDGKYTSWVTVNNVVAGVPGLAVSQGPTSITWTVPRSAVAPLAKPRQVFELVNAETKWMSTTSDKPNGGPEAFYPDRSANCRPFLCPLVPDDPGEAAYTPAVPTPLDFRPSARPLEIHGLDVATGAKTVVVALLVENTTIETTKPADPVETETFTQGRMRWSATFVAGGTTYTVRRTRTGVGPAGQQGTYTNELLVNGAAVAVPTLKVTVTKTAITWTIPRAAVSALKPRQAISGLRADTTWTDADRAVDSVTSAPWLTYPDRAPSCLNAS